MDVSQINRYNAMDLSVRCNNLDESIPVRLIDLYNRKTSKKTMVGNLYGEKFSDLLAM